MSPLFFLVINSNMDFSEIIKGIILLPHEFLLMSTCHGKQVRSSTLPRDFSFLCRFSTWCRRSSKILFEMSIVVFYGCISFFFIIGEGNEETNDFVSDFAL